jgi:hypothetical protein
MSSVQANGPTAVEKRQYLDDYRKRRRQLADIMAEAAEVRGGIRSTLKAFENKGGSSKQLKRMFELTDMTKAEAEAEVAEYMGYAADIGIRVVYDSSGQGGLGDVMDPPPRKGAAKKAAAPPQPTVVAEQSVEDARAYSDGWNTAKAGGTIMDNVKKAGTSEHQQWTKGFNDYVWEQEHGRSPAEPPAGAPAPAGADLPPDPAA